MPFTKEQSDEIKKQLLEQVEKLPNENKDQIKEYIKNLDDAGLEDFLKKNKIKISETGETTPQQTAPEKPIFQSIVNGEIPSYKIEENEKAIAILEINPASKGHSIVLPKKPCEIEKIPKIAFSLAQKIAKRIKNKLRPEEIKIETSSFQNYPFINIIPLYKDTPLKKEKADEKELEKLKNRLELKKRTARTVKKNQKKEPSNEMPEIHFRIP
ncbi:HIT domain-containing protein [Candidatus Pacearchaeota archaeon]|nr:HIT domain-containing protein [Candidatus Pacearchaeota archaeon]MBD3283114.1 HIT domain-containing protein [Candidatus Pacearchaeota archaeon]